MKAITEHKITKSIILLFILVCCFQAQGNSQKNSIKITPLKLLFERTNISYERQIKQGLSIIADGQIWFEHEKETNLDSRLGIDSKPVLVSNSGLRFSLEARAYDNLLTTDNNKINFYLGLGGFGGKHSISMVRESFQYITAQGSFWTNWDTAPELTAETQLISSGVYLNSGFQFCLGSTLSFDLGIIFGKAWTNQKDDFLTLYSYEYYVIEEERIKLDKNYSKKISGFYFEPMFTMNFCF